MDGDIDDDYSDGVDYNYDIVLVSHIIINMCSPRHNHGDNHRLSCKYIDSNGESDIYTSSGIFSIIFCV